MAGLVWFVQVVHYPLLAHVGEHAFCAYERQHARRTTRVVAPAMLLEAAAAVLLVFLLPPTPLLLLSVALLALLWLWTFLLMVPLHNALCRAHDPDRIRRLVLLNWPRTLAWSARAVIAFLLTAA